MWTSLRQREDAKQVFLSEQVEDHQGPWQTDGSADPYKGLLEAVLVHGEGHLLLLHTPEPEQVRWSKIRRIGCELEQLNAVDGEPLLVNSDSMYRHAIIVEKPPLL